MLVTTPWGGCSVFRSGNGGTGRLPRGPGVGGGQPRGRPQPPSRCAGVYLYFASRGGWGEDGEEAALRPPSPGWVVPCRSLHRAQGTKGPGGPCVSPPPPPALWRCPPGGAVWRSASEVRTPEGCAVCGTPELGGGHGLPTHIRHPSWFPSEHLPRKLSPAGPSPPPPQQGSEVCRPCLL